MTTIMLAKKLLAMKTCENKLEKIQNLRKCNLRDLTMTERSLKRLLKNQKGIQKCRLCLRPAETYIFNNKGDSSIADDIKIILNIKIKENDGRPQFICSTCQSIVHKAVELRQSAEVVQWRLQQEAEMVRDSACNENGDDCNNLDDDVKLYTEASKNVTSDEYLHSQNRNDEWKCKENLKKGNRTKRGPYMCETCGLELKTMWRLKTHMLVHTNNFNYSCKHCPYRTRNQYSLQIHVRTHTGDRPYQCAVCPATFTSTSNLASHRRSHLPPAYICDTCNKGFKFKQPLLNHIATQHRSAKPFCCNTCGQSFSTRKLLRRHERKSHNRPKMRIGATPCYIKSQEEVDMVSQEDYDKAHND